MKNIFISITYLLALFLTIEVYSASDVHLSKGEQYRIRVSQGNRYSIGNPEVIRVKSTVDQNGKSILLVQARQLGYSDLVVMGENSDKTYKFQVSAKRAAAFAIDVKRLLQGMPGIRTQKTGTGWVISGQARSVEDYEKILALRKNQPKRIRFIGRLSKTALTAAQLTIASHFKEAGIEFVTIKRAGQHYWLEGTVTKEREKRIAEEIARQILPSIQSHIRVAFENATTLRFQVKMLEAIRADRDNVGFSWTTNIPKLFQVHKHFLKGSFSLDASLDALSKRGLVKVLSKPMIYVNERGRAELRVGGEIPIKIQSRKRQSISWKQYGLLLQISVPGHANGLTRAKIKVQISDLDFSNAIDGLPGLRINNMETEVDLSDGKTVFLSGLLQTQKQRDQKGLAILQDIPVLGELFKSKTFLERKSELLIAISATAEAL